jgi:uncharacterized membrane protein
MDIGATFGFITKDERWVMKVLIGGLVLLIPLIGTIAMYGYVIKTAQNVARGVEQPLPEWSDFGDHLKRGFMQFVITIVYMLPYIVVYMLFAIITGVAGAAAEGGQDSGPLALIGLCLLPIALILALFGAIASYAGVVRYAVTESLGEAFKFNEIIALLRNNVGMWAMFFLLLIVASFVGSLGVIACGIGMFFTIFFGQLMVGHGLGQIMQKLYPQQPLTTYTPPPSYTPPTFTQQ